MEERNTLGCTKHNWDQLNLPKEKENKKKTPLVCTVVKKKLPLNRLFANGQPVVNCVS